MSGIFGSDTADDKITVAMLSDALDTLGERDRSLNISLRPIRPGMRVIGIARTAKFVPAKDQNPSAPYDAAIDFIDGALSGEVLVIATDRTNASAVWGELFSAAAIGRGALGVVTDGNLRDIDKIADLGFPAFSFSSRPLDFKGRMELADQLQPVDMGGLKVYPADLVGADEDGVVVVPRDLIPAVLELAREKAKAETIVLEDLRNGKSLRQVWSSYGVL